MGGWVGAEAPWCFPLTVSMARVVGRLAGAAPSCTPRGFAALGTRCFPHPSAIDDANAISQPRWASSDVTRAR